MRISRWGGAAALGAALALAVASPGQAQDGFHPDAGWDLRQIGTGDADWSPAAESQIVDAATVELTKPAGDVGTSAETADLGLPVAAGDEITVAYELLDGALPDAGAVRLFWYDHPDADTLGVAPTAFVAADALSGTLALAVAADATVGTLGLVYDASNMSAGTVRFTDLAVAGEPVLFRTPELEPDPSPSAEPDPDPTDPPAAGKGGEADELPTTGLPMPVMLAGGGLLGLAGGGTLWLTRRRRPQFTA